MMKRQAAIFMLFLLSISVNTQADSTLKQMKTDVARGNWEVIWSESYGFEKAALLAACVYVGCAQSYLGHELDSLKSKVGDQLLEQALRNKGKVIFGPGELKIQAGTAYWSTYYNVWNPLRNRNEKVTTARYVRLYVKYRRTISSSNVRSRYLEYGLQLSNSDANHWDAHRRNVGKSRWEKDFHRDVVKRLFGQCHDPIGNDLQHWINHSFNVSPSKFVTDVRNDWRCK